MDTDGSQDDLAIPRLHFEILRGADGGSDALGQGDLIFGGDFGKHLLVASIGKQGILTLT